MLVSLFSAEASNRSHNDTLFKSFLLTYYIVCEHRCREYNHCIRQGKFMGTDTYEFPLLDYLTF